MGVMSQNAWVVENDISGPQGEAVKAGWLVWKMQIVGRRGCMDRWHFRDGVLVIIEYKKVGKDMSANQVKRKEELQRAGFRVHTVDNHDRARKLLRIGRYA